AERRLARFDLLPKNWHEVSTPVHIRTRIPVGSECRVQPRIRVIIAVELIAVEPHNDYPSSDFTPNQSGPARLSPHWILPRFPSTFRRPSTPAAGRETASLSERSHSLCRCVPDPLETDPPPL